MGLVKKVRDLEREIKNAEAELEELRGINALSSDTFEGRKQYIASLKKEREKYGNLLVEEIKEKNRLENFRLGKIRFMEQVIKQAEVMSMKTIDFDGYQIEQKLLEIAKTEMNEIRATFDESEELSKLIRNLKAIQYTVAEKSHETKKDDALSRWLDDLFSDVGAVSSSLFLYKYVLDGYKESIEGLERKIEKFSAEESEIVLVCKEKS